MRQLAFEIAQIRSDNRSTAEISCAYLDLVRPRGLRPPDLTATQTGLRRDLLRVESRLRTVRGRSNALRRRIRKRLKGATAESRDAVLRHLEGLRVRERVLVLRRLLLRQIADASVWVALRLDARIILPLFREQTHQLPQREGLGGPAEIARQAMGTGKFLVFENDLTRCLGLGDLTVVYADRAWRRPLQFEVKSSARPAWKLGAELRVQLYGVHSSDPVDAEMSAEFERAIGGGPLPPEEPSRERPEQTAELLSGTQLLVATTTVNGERLPGPSRRMWKALALVLTRAFAEGSCFDLAERGVAFIAIRSVDDQAPEEVSREMFERVRDIPGFGAECKVASSVDLRNNDEWSTIALPIALWPIGRDLRAALLTGELYMACIVRPEAWRDAMKAEGLDLLEEGKAWMIRSASGATRIDPLEVGKLTLGVAFSGVSPREIAAGLAASLSPGPV